MGNALLIGDALGSKRSLEIEQNGVESVPWLLERGGEALGAKLQAGIVQLLGVEVAEELAVPGRKVGEGFSDSENSAFLGQNLSRRCEGKAQPEAGEEKPRLLG